MFLLRFLPTNRAEADDEQSHWHSRLQQHPHTLSGSDSVRPPDETESSLTDLNYSKRLSGLWKIQVL
jgi:hypothetical protein